jgi:ribosomal protein S18 acetylase RimI-like enzyme
MEEMKLDDVLRTASRYQRVFNGRGDILVAQYMGTDVGYAAWCKDRMPWPAAFATPPIYAELLSLCVLPAFRRQGIGTALMEAVARATASHEYQELMVSVLPQNTAAVHLFERYDFVAKWLILTCFGRRLKLSKGLPLLPVEAVWPSEVNALEPVWVSVHHEHKRVAPHLSPFVSDSETWSVYSRTFRPSADEGLLFRVGPANSPVAMGCASILDDTSRFRETWATAPTISEIEVLAALPGSRGKGYGTALMRQLEAQLLKRGVRDLVIGAVATNAAPIRLYESWGFRPACLQLTRALIHSPHSRLGLNELA